jgi:hypothetical protein
MRSIFEGRFLGQRGFTSPPPVSPLNVPRAAGYFGRVDWHRYTEVLLKKSEDALRKLEEEFDRLEQGGANPEALREAGAEVAQAKSEVEKERGDVEDAVESLRAWETFPYDDPPPVPGPLFPRSQPIKFQSTAAASLPTVPLPPVASVDMRTAMSPTPGTPFGAPQEAGQGPYSLTPPAGQPVASTACPAGQFWDGTKCRGSVGAMPAIPGGLAPSGGGAVPVAAPYLSGARIERGSFGRSLWT